MASAKQTRKYETRKHQREARESGTPSPRWLARSMAKHYCRHNGISESECGGYFRQVCKDMPKTGRKRLYPKPTRTVQKVPNN